MRSEKKASRSFLVPALLVAAAAAVLVWWVVKRPPSRVAGPGRKSAADAGGSPHARPAAGTREKTPSRNEAVERERVPAGETVPVEGKGDRSSETEAASVTGRFLDREGFPVQNVSVKGFSRWGIDAAAVSGPDGRFRLEQACGWKGEGKAPSFTLRFSAYRKGYARTEQKVTVTPGREVSVGDLVLNPGGEVSGTVKDAGGRGVPGAHVWVTVAKPVERSREELERWGPGISGAGVSTGPEGSFLYEGAPAGFVRVWAQGQGTCYAFTDPIEVKAGKTVEGIELILKKFAPEDAVSGVVLDPEGRPVPRARLRLRYKTFFSSGSTSTSADREGRFEIVLKKKASYTVEARDREGRYTPAVKRGVSPGTHGLVLRLAPRKQARLVVRDAGGDLLPVPFRVEIRCGERDYQGETHRFQARDLDEEGCAAIAVPDAPFKLTVKAEGYESAVVDPVDPGRIPDPLMVTLRPVPGVTGRAWIEGEPAPGVRVTLHEAVERGGYRVNGFPCRSKPDAESRAETDGPGRFRLHLERSGRFFLRAVKPGFAPAESGPLDIDHRKGLADLEIRLTPGGILEGWVIAPPGRDPAGVIVGISRGDGFAVTTRTAEGGYYRFEHLIPGRWDVRVREKEIVPRSTETFYSASLFARKPEIPWTCVVAEGKRTRYDLDLSEGMSCILQCRLTLDGAVPDAWTAELAKGTGDLFIHEEGVRTYRDGEGRFVLQAKEPGTYTLELRGRSRGGTFLSLTDTVEIGRGLTPWALDITTGRVRLEGLDHWKAPGTFLFYLWEGRPGLRVAARIEGGEAGAPVILFVPTGAGRVVRVRPDAAAPEGYVEDRARVVEARAGETVTVRL